MSGAHAIHSTRAVGACPFSHFVSIDASACYRPHSSRASLISASSYTLAIVNPDPNPAEEDGNLLIAATSSMLTGSAVAQLAAELARLSSYVSTLFVIALL